jgi:hypothetical protein
MASKKKGVTMASTVNNAFAEFLKDKVNLDPDETKNAKGSRDWLVEQIHKFEEKDDFPTLYNEKDIFFGSFARRTKIRELDDIDIMICLHAQGSTYYTFFDRIELTVRDDATTLLELCHENTNKLNSRKVINKFIAKLNEVPQYEKAETNRNKEAATLKLKSYSWNFDIVPCFFTNKEADGRDFYLIPDGNGHWKKTDPRIDNDRTTAINQKHNGKVLNAIRLIKYWNKRPTMPSMSSYLLECIILNFYNSKISCSDYIDFEVRDIILHIKDAVYSTVQDPKNIQGDLNHLSFDERQKISTKALIDYNKAVEAWNYENNKDQESAIKKWKEIFGDDFPNYS